VKIDCRDGWERSREGVKKQKETSLFLWWDGTRARKLRPGKRGKRLYISEPALSIAKMRLSRGMAGLGLGVRGGGLATVTVPRSKARNRRRAFSISLGEERAGGKKHLHANLANRWLSNNDFRIKGEWAAAPCGEERNYGYRSLTRTCKKRGCPQGDYNWVQEGATSGKMLGGLV